MPKEINPIENKEQQIADLEKKNIYLLEIIKEITDAIAYGDMEKKPYFTVVDKIKETLKTHQSDNVSK